MPATKWLRCFILHSKLKPETWQIPNLKAWLYIPLPFQHLLILYSRESQALPQCNSTAQCSPPWVTTQTNASWTGMPWWEEREPGQPGALLAAHSRRADFTLFPHAWSVPLDCLALYLIRGARLADTLLKNSTHKFLLWETQMCLIQLISPALPSISCYRYWTCFHQNVESPTQSLPSLSTSSWSWTRQSSTNSGGKSSYSLGHIISSPLPLDKYPKGSPSNCSAD